MSGIVEIDIEEDDDECQHCGGEGEVIADCIEDCCNCIDPEESHGYIRCEFCDGTGLWRPPWLRGVSHAD
jgi:hypothetical protein